MNTDLADKIRGLSSAHFDDTVRHRRHLHAHPELSFEEKETSRYVAAELLSLGIPFREGVGGYGLVASIEGRDPESATFALRADMDALPIRETNEVDYRSRNEGVMHACGHDVHTSSLLTAARILAGVRDEFRGTVRMLFQPAEERFPGGASLMIADGALENPAPAGILGQHVQPALEAGKAGFHAGPYMASADELYFTVRGRGGHAAYPHLTDDPVLTAAHLITALQRVVARFSHPWKPMVLSIGRVIADGATNVIPGEVKLDGTLRAFDDEMRFRAHDEIRRIAGGVARTHGLEIDAEVGVGYPALVNHEELTARARSLAEAYLGADRVVDLDISMGGEDFAYYSHQTPACFYRLGTGNEAKGITSPIHTPTFDIDEAALEIGPGLMAWMAVNEVERAAGESDA